MAKKMYPSAKQTLAILTQVNEKYNCKEIPQIITTTNGTYKQSGHHITITKSK